MNTQQPAPSVPVAPATANDGLNRRDFVKTAALAGASFALSSTLLGAATATTTSATPNSGPGHRRRYAIVGCGGRHRMYHTAILDTYKDSAELVAVCDINIGRANLSANSAAKKGAQVKAYHSDDFDKMVKETKPDIVIVTTVDAFHDFYIVRAMELGCDAITEKPMTIDAEKCQRILDAKKRTGKNLRVTFNYRYSPPRTQVKDLLMSGEIGEILSVDFHWLLNTTHGTDYFRRWHSQKKFSGGLMLHKATHHFDLVNWWLGASPESVVAVGKRDFYTPAMAKRLGLESYHERCHTCPEGNKCTFRMDLAGTPALKTLYLDNEKYDGYFRDRCVFRPEIDIEDTMNVVVKYDSSATLSYSLNAFNAWEGYTIAFNGTKGRLEHSIVEQMYVNGMGSDADQGAIKDDGVSTRIIPLRGAPIVHKPWRGEGSHGGGDKAMLDDVFLPEPPADKYKRNSDERGGAASILIGAAANQCFKSGKSVRIADMVKGLSRPDYTPMPNNSDSVPMPRAPNVKA